VATLSFPLSPAEIATATGCPAANVARHWPAVRSACAETGIVDLDAVIAVLATIATEVRSFEPIEEWGGPAQWRKYDNRKDLGNVHPGDGVRFHGRGFIQLTGRVNYRAYGRELGIPLEEHPERALDPAVAARILAVYFRDREIPALARAHDWRAVRRKVNGGYNGWDTFIAAVTRLQHAVAEKAGGRPTIREGSHGTYVAELKLLLEKWSTHHPLPRPLAQTPSFGPATTLAVEAFQTSAGLAATGVVDPVTWRALDAATASAT
jgi:hypothetical protein